jgi:hypothetical protein
MNAARSLVKWILRFILLYLLFIVFFMVGSMAVTGVMPDSSLSEPGLVPETRGLLIIALADLLVIGALILTSHWGGWKLALSVALAYYGAGTFLMQIETWYFLSSITVGPRLLPQAMVDRDAGRTAFQCAAERWAYPCQSAHTHCQRAAEPSDRDGLIYLSLRPHRGLALASRASYLCRSDRHLSASRKKHEQIRRTHAEFTRARVMGDVIRSASPICRGPKGYRAGLTKRRIR